MRGMRGDCLMRVTSSEHSDHAPHLPAQKLTLYRHPPTVSNTLIVLGLVKIFGWSIGMLEALTLSILLGLAVDYLLHVSEEYSLIVNANPAIDRYTAVRQVRACACVWVLCALRARCAAWSWSAGSFLCVCLCLRFPVRCACS